MKKKMYSLLIHLIFLLGILSSCLDIMHSSYVKTGRHHDVYVKINLSVKLLTLVLRLLKLSLMFASCSIFVSRE